MTFVVLLKASMSLKMDFNFAYCSFLAMPIKVSLFNTGNCVYKWSVSFELWGRDGLPTVIVIH